MAGIARLDCPWAASSREAPGAGIGPVRRQPARKAWGSDLLFSSLAGDELGGLFLGVWRCGLLAPLEVSRGASTLHAVASSVPGAHQGPWAARGSPSCTRFLSEGE